jgi:hypothetical protein
VLRTEPAVRFRPCGFHPCRRLLAAHAVANVRLRHIIVSMAKFEVVDELQRLLIDDEREADIQHDLALLREQSPDPLAESTADLD